MMSKLLRILCFLAPVLNFSIIMPAQTLSPLPQSKDVVSGSLANGLRYYLVSNPSYKGMIDIALVQKAGYEDDPYERRGDAVVVSRTALTSLEHLGGISPYTYMYGKRLWPGSDGYVKVGRSSTVYRFERLVTSRKGEIIDSTLLMLFDIIGQDHGAVSDIYSTDNQAIIASGDLIPQEILGKMNMLSLFVSGKPRGERVFSYEWQDMMTPEVSIVQGPPSVTVTYRYPRTGADRMNTAVPLVTSRYAEELKALLGRRLGWAFKAEGIAVSSIEFTYRSSRDQDSDESFSVSVAAAEKDLPRVLEIISGVLADLDTGGVDAEEYSELDGVMTLSIFESYGSPATENERYMEGCISAFLYGSSLASDEDKIRFFTGRKVDPGMSARLFSNFLSALLDRSRNLSIIWSAPGDEQTVLHTYQSAWKPLDVHIPAMRGDTLSLPGASRAKITSTMPEKLFGGQVWTFNNGIKVIYKQLPQSGFIRWQWVLKGGYSSLPGISPGEGGHLADMVRLNKVGGMSPDRFFGMLGANGMSLNTDISFSETMLSGSAPDGKLHLLMKSLLALTRDRVPDEDAWEYYRSCDALRNTERSVEYVLDSLVHQSVKHSPYKIPGDLRDDFPSRAAKFYGNAFGKMNDGVLIMVGGMSPEYVSKVLCQYMGGFKTERAYSIRSRIRHGMREGHVSYRTSAPEPFLAISLGSPFNYTTENAIAANIAAFTMGDHISAAVSSMGWRAESDWTLKMFPDESVDMTVYLHRLPPEGIPATMAVEDSVDVVLDRVRSAVWELGSKGISPGELDAAKGVAAGYYSTWASNPASVMGMLVLRYSYGKDLITGYESKLSSVSAAAVDPILSNMAHLVSGEYIVSRSVVPSPDKGSAPESKPLYVPPMTYVKGAYPFDGSFLPPEPLGTAEFEDIPVRDFGEDSSHIAWRDSVVLGRALRALEPEIDKILDEGGK